MSYDRGFDASASQFAGGGFVPSPTPQGGYSSEPISKRSGNVNQTLRAVTVKKLLEENANVADDRFTVDGQDIHTITIVGKIVSVQEQATRAILQIHDGTAGIEVTHWINDTDADLMAAKKLEWQPGTYIRVYGTFKVFEKRRSINAYSIKTVTDHNEVTHHFLQCIFQHLHLTRGTPPPLGAAPTNLLAAPRTQYPAAHPTGSYGSADETLGGELPHLVLSIYNDPRVINRPGVSVDEVHDLLRAEGRPFSLPQVVNAVEALANEGKLYNTTNDRCYRSAGPNA